MQVRISRDPSPLQCRALETQRPQLNESYGDGEVTRPRSLPHLYEIIHNPTQEVRLLNSALERAMSGRKALRDL
jgi:hypothetical protein